MRSVRADDLRALVITARFMVCLDHRNAGELALCTGHRCQ